jgi:hypothetical protein
MRPQRPLNLGAPFVIGLPLGRITRHFHEKAGAVNIFLVDN